MATVQRKNRSVNIYILISEMNVGAILILLCCCISSYNATKLDKGSINWNANSTGCTFWFSGSNNFFNATDFDPQQLVSPSIQSLDWFSGPSSFGVGVLLPYVPADAVWVIRFSPFNPAVDDLNAPGTCENRKASQFTSLTFAQWWYHQSSANRFLSNNTGQPGYGGDQWAVSSSGNYCDVFLASGTFPLSTLSSCRTPQGTKELTVIDTGYNGNIILNGTLYVTLVIPQYTAYGSGSKAGYIANQYAYPFILNIPTTTSAIIKYVSGGTAVSIAIRSLGIYATGANMNKMYLTIETTFLADGFGFLQNGMLTSSTGDTLVLASVSPQNGTIGATPIVQTWQWISSSTSAIFDGLYSFKWTGVKCTGLAGTCIVGNDFQYNVMVALRRANSSLSQGSFGTIVSVYGDKNFTIPQSAPFYDGSPICLKNSLLANSADNTAYAVTILNAYLCIPNSPDGTITYDGTTNFGCLNATYSTPIVKTSSVDPSAIGSAVASYYAPKLVGLQYPVDSGLCILAKPSFLTTSQTFVKTAYKQYVHIQSKVTYLLSGKKRTEITDTVYAATSLLQEYRSDKYPNLLSEILILQSNTSESDVTLPTATPDLVCLDTRWTFFGLVIGIVTSVSFGGTLTYICLSFGELRNNKRPSYRHL